MQLRTGLELEQLWGHTAWLVIYLVSGAYASLASCVLLPDLLGVGSSGALSGVVGAWLPFALITWSQVLPKDRKVRGRQLLVILASIVGLIAFGFLPMMDYAAHVAGVAAGAALSAIIFANRLLTTAGAVLTRAAGLAAFAALTCSTMWWFAFQTEPDELLLDL